MSPKVFVLNFTCSLNRSDDRKDRNIAHFSLIFQALVLKAHYYIDVMVIYAKRQKLGITFGTFCSPGVAEEFLGAGELKNHPPESGILVLSLYKSFLKKGKHFADISLMKIAILC